MPAQRPAPEARQGGSGGERPRTVRVRPATVRAGVTSFAVLAGLSCYVFLAQWHINQTLAVVIGLVFALMVRVAAGSLAREWLAAHSAPPGERPDGAQNPPTRGDSGQGRR